MGFWSKLFGGNTPTEPGSTSSPGGGAAAGFFVFDYNKMDSSYGEQAFRAISAGLKGARGTCAFCDGDVSPDAVRQLAQQAANVTPKDQGSPLADVARTSPFGPYVAAMWTDTGTTFARIHSHLVKSGTPGYLGYLTLKGEHEHLAFIQAMGGQLYLPTGIAFVDGSVVPQTSKYGVQ